MWKLKGINYESVGVQQIEYFDNLLQVEVCEMCEN